mgnify:CR=1 FL=1
MALYLDTSAFVKLFCKEEHSGALRAWLEERHEDLVASDLLRTEALRVARKLSPEATLLARQLLEAVSLVTVSSDICERAADLDPDIMRSLDAIHVATALALGDRLSAVVTYDARMADACAAYGLRVEAPRER